MNLEDILKNFDYSLPERLIAQTPASPRDSAKLLVYKGWDSSVSYDTFAHLPKYLPKNSVLVFNQTRVVPARLTVQKETGGRAEILYLNNTKDTIKFLSNKNLPLNNRVTVLSGRLKLPHYFKVIKKEGSFYFLKPSFAISKIQAVLEKYGKTPLPPYIKHSPLKEGRLRKEYQTIFAKTGFSVAAPTASLHFTKKLMSTLKKQGIDIKFVQLDVGLGTFASLKDENIKLGKLHLEKYKIDFKTAKFLNKTKEQGRPIIAVGTTVVRTLESAANEHKLQKLFGDTSLFIRPGYKFKFVTGIITNFHVPKSSLLMLVSAFIGRKNILDLYRKAIKKNFRFFSFGDGMLLIPVDIFTEK